MTDGGSFGRNGIALSQGSFGDSDGTSEPDDLFPKPRDAPISGLASPTLSGQFVEELRSSSLGFGELTGQVEGQLSDGGEFVTVVERLFHRLWLILAPLARTKRANPIGVGAPLSRPPSLAGDRHPDHRNETQRYCAPTG